MIAIAFGTINIVGGFLVTDRMLRCQVQRKPRGRRRRGPKEKANERGPFASSFLQNENFLDVLYIIAFSLFIQGLRGSRGRRPRSAATGSPRSAWRSR